MEKYGFVYIWLDKKYKRYYIGCRWGHENDGYICSSRWMMKSYKRRPLDFKRKILSKIYSNKKDLLEEEYKWLQLIKENELGKKYYNIHNHHFNHWSADLNKCLSVGEKISLSHKNDPNWGKWGKGKEISEETKEKLRQHNLGKKHTEETKQKCRSYKHTPEAIEKIRQSSIGNTNTKGKPSPLKGIPTGRTPVNKGKPKTEEQRQKLREAWVLRKQKFPEVTKETRQKLKTAILNRQRDNNGRVI